MEYPGGKGACFRHIVNLMPPHDVYIESHLGGGNVLERKKPARLNIGIDADAGLIDVWNRRLQRGPIAGDVDAAASVNVTGAARAVGISGDIAGGIDACSDGTRYEFVHGDAVDFLLKYEFTGRELVYCDPPYVMSTRKGGELYQHEYTDDDHRRLLGTVKGLPCYVMISGYWSSLYAASLEGWHYVEFPNTTRRGVVTESLWMNYRPNGVLHDYRCIGQNFRERERIKRKLGRWKSRLSAMPAAERHAIAEMIEGISRAERPLPAELSMPDPIVSDGDTVPV